MSDGMRDARAVGSLSAAVEQAAIELRVAIRKADEGHRGLRPAVEAIVNEQLTEVGYEIRKVL